jgi:hypothetical protein
MCGRKWLVANLTIDQSIYNFWPRIHSYHLVESLALRAFKLIAEHSSSSDSAAARYVHVEELQDAFDFRNTAAPMMTGPVLENGWGQRKEAPATTSDRDL